MTNNFKKSSAFKLTILLSMVLLSIGFYKTASANYIYYNSDTARSIFSTGVQVGGNIFTSVNTGLVSFGTDTANNPYIQGDASNNLFLGTGGSARITILNSSGNVGIGTTGPSSKLHVGGGPITLDSGYRLRWAGDNVGIIGVTNSYLSFVTGNATERMRIDGTGNVGIGTTNPVGKLEIHDDVATLTNENDYAIKINNGNSEVGLVIGVSSSTGIGVIQTLDPGNSWTTKHLIIQPNGGNVGIATTTPGSKLTVAGQIYSSTGGVKFPDGTTQTTAAGTATVPAPNVSAGAFGGNTGGGNYSFPANVGIGTTTPGANLEINTTSPSLRLSASQSPSSYRTDLLTSYSDIGTTRLQMSGQNMLMAQRFPVQTSLYTFNSGGTPDERITILGSGNVGIGTTNPGAKLDIAGGVNLTDRQYTLLGNVRTFENVAQYYPGSTPTTGTVVVTIGNTPNIMLDAEIVIQGYQGLTKCHVRGYTYTSTAGWHLPAATCLGSGSVGSYEVRFGKRISDNARVIMIGNTATNWGNYPHVVIPRVSYGYPGSGISAGDWTISMVTDESAYDSIVGVTENNGFNASNSTFGGNTYFPGSGIWNSSGNVGIGTTGPGQKLTVAGTIESTSGGVKFPDGTTQTTAAGTATVPAANVSAGSFGGNTGGGNYTFPGSLAINGGLGMGGTMRNIQFAYTHLGETGSSAGTLLGNNMRASTVSNATLEIGSNATDAAHGLYTMYNDGWRFISVPQSHGLAVGTAVDQATYTKVRITTAGSVGIGTTNPGQKLTVAGTIESTSGGVKFPDGTTQTTAFMGSSTQIVSAPNVSAGAFGGNTGGGNYAFPSRIAFGGTTFGTGNYYGVGNGMAYNNTNSIAVDTVETDGGVGGAGTLELIYYGGTNVMVGPSGSKPIYASSFVDGNSNSYLLDPAGTSNLQYANFGGGSSSNWAVLNVGGSTSIQTAGAIYSYDKICVGNSSGACTGTGGVVLSGTNVKFPDGTTQATAATGGWTTSGSSIYNPNSGNVGIGMTSPNEKLSVGNTSGGAGISLSTNLTGTTQSIFHVGNTGSGQNDAWMRLSDNGVAKVNIAANNARGGDTYFNGGGKFGIGTDVPNSKLHVKSGVGNSAGQSATHDDIIIEDDDYPYINLNAATTGAAGLWMSDDAYQRAGMYYSFPDDVLHLYSAGGSKVSIGSSGSLRLANGFELQQGGSNYGQFNSWVFLNGNHGFYSNSNVIGGDAGAHIYPNNGSYGSWRISGSRNGWYGLEFDNPAGQSTFMMGATGQTTQATQRTGVHHNGNGAWSWLWEGSTLLVGNVPAARVSPGTFQSGDFTMSGTLTIGGTGKLNVSTIDPLYTIGGKRYATFVPAMVGQKEETTGKIILTKSGDEWIGVIDFKKELEGSDLWLFSKITNLKAQYDKMTILLTSSFNGNIWYEKDEKNMKLIIKGNKGGEVSYRLTAPRFDGDKWTNRSTEKEKGFILDELIKD